MWEMFYSEGQRQLVVAKKGNVYESVEDKYTDEGGIGVNEDYSMKYEDTTYSN